MEASQVSPADHSLTLQYLGVCFRRFVFALQEAAAEPILQEFEWYWHVLAEVVHAILYFIFHSMNFI